MDRIQPGSETAGAKIGRRIKGLARTKWGKALLLVVGAFLAGALFVVTFLTACGRPPEGFQPITAPLSDELRRATEEIPGYARPEASTFLTFSEWYLVFNPQEYAATIAVRSPSSFPYFRSIGQLWNGYCRVSGVARAGSSFSGGDHLRNMVIASSFTAEYVVKGLWENTLGRISEFLADGERVPEDDYAAKVAREYGEFVPTKPFYEFPYGRALVGTWTEVPLFGPHPFRKWERKLFLTLEYGVKAAYCIPITLATRSIYGIAAEEVHAVAIEVPPAAFNDPRVRRVANLARGATLVAVPHYQGFTDTVPGFLRTGARFLDIAGNDEILLTVVVPRGALREGGKGTELFRMPMLLSDDSERIAIRSSAFDLGDILAEVEAAGGKLEHLYDY